MSQKKGQYKPRLTVEQSKEIIELFLAGKTIDEIAALTNRSKSVVRQRIHLAPEFGIKLPNYVKVPTKHEHQEIKEIDLSSLDNSILFEHSKEYVI